MKKAIVKLRGTTPVTFGKYHQTPKIKGETDAEYEQRTFRERLHYTSNGNVSIPGIMLCNCIRESAKFLSISIPGKGKSTYTKHFTSIMPEKLEGIVLGVKKESVPGSPQHVPSDGMVGGTKRVMKIFPIVQEWEGTITILIPDPVINAEVFETVMRNAGYLIGIGTWRPRSRGMNGRFELVDMKWIENSN